MHDLQAISLEGANQQEKKSHVCVDRKPFSIAFHNHL